MPANPFETQQDDQRQQQDPATVPLPQAGVLPEQGQSQQQDGTTPVEQTPQVPASQIKPLDPGPFDYTKGNLLTPWQNIGGQNYPEAPPPIDWSGAEQYDQQIDDIAAQQVAPRPYTPYDVPLDVSAGAFEASPEYGVYENALRGGLQDQAFAASARNMLGHGNTLAAANQLATETARQHYNDFYQRRFAEHQSNRQQHLIDQNERQEIWDSERQLDAFRAGILSARSGAERQEAEANYQAAMQQYQHHMADYDRRRSEFLESQNRQYQMLMDRLQIGLQAGGAPDPAGGVKSGPKAPKSSGYQDDAPCPAGQVRGSDGKCKPIGQQDQGAGGGGAAPEPETAEDTPKRNDPVQVERCHSRGGAWNEETQSCDYADPNTVEQTNRQTPGGITREECARRGGRWTAKGCEFGAESPRQRKNDCIENNGTWLESQQICIGDVSGR